MSVCLYQTAGPIVLIIREVFYWSRAVYKLISGGHSLPTLTKK